MESNNEHYRTRTKQLALDIIKLADQLPAKPASWVLSKQVIRSATSVAANYRAMCLARSAAERFAKLCIVVEECDETTFWLEMIAEAGLLSVPTQLLEEASILSKTFTSYRAKLRPTT